MQPAELFSNLIDENHRLTLDEINDWIKLMRPTADSGQEEERLSDIQIALENFPQLNPCQKDFEEASLTIFSDAKDAAHYEALGLVMIYKLNEWRANDLQKRLDVSEKATKGALVLLQKKILDKIYRRADFARDFGAMEITNEQEQKLVLKQPNQQPASNVFNFKNYRVN